MFFFVYSEIIDCDSNRCHEIVEINETRDIEIESKRILNCLFKAQLQSFQKQLCNYDFVSTCIHSTYIRTCICKCVCVRVVNLTKLFCGLFF